MTHDPGDAVWLGLGGAASVWLVVSSLAPRVPGVAEVVRAACGSWLGRLLLLGLWAEAGLHVLTQRP